MNTKTKKRNKIKKRIRKVVFGTSERPRMTVFRSNKAIYALLLLRLYYVNKLSRWGYW